MAYSVKHGGRKPSDDLSLEINQLSDAVFADVLLLGNIDATSKAAKHRLILWHRGKAKYDYQGEAEAFSGYDVKSLRRAAIKELRELVDELYDKLPRELAGMGLRGDHNWVSTAGWIKVYKDRARARGYYKSLIQIVEFEQKAATSFLSGDELAFCLESGDRDLEWCRTSMQLAEDVKVYYRDYLEVVRRGIKLEGKVKEDVVRAYFESGFHLQEVDCFHPSLQCEKLLIDEYFHVVNNDTQKAVALAQRISDINSSEKCIDNERHCKLLTRLARYYSELGDLVNATKVLEHFRVLALENPVNRDVFLAKYVRELFKTGLELNKLPWAKDAAKILRQNQENIIGCSDDSDWIEILIAAIFHHLAAGEIGNAFEYCEMLARTKDQATALPYKIRYRVAHLMVLFEKRDFVGMQSHGKNYAEYFREHRERDAMAPALEILIFLRGSLRAIDTIAPQNPLSRAASNPKEFNEAMESLLERLRSYEKQGSTKLSLWYKPVYAWIERLKIKNHLEEPQ